MLSRDRVNPISVQAAQIKASTGSLNPKWTISVTVITRFIQKKKKNLIVDSIWQLYIQILSCWISFEHLFFLLSLNDTSHKNNLIYFTLCSLALSLPMSLSPCLSACFLFVLMNDFWDNVLLRGGVTEGLGITLLLMIIKRTICAKLLGCFPFSPHMDRVIYLGLFFQVLSFLKVCAIKMHSKYCVVFCLLT